MSIGTPVNLSVPTVGTTVHALDKVKDGVYRKFVADAEGNNVAIELNLRPAAVDSPLKTISIVLKYAPSTYDGQFSTTQGRVSLSFQANALVGSVMSQASVLDFIKYFGSLLAHASLPSDLLSGAIQ